MGEGRVRVISPRIGIAGLIIGELIMASQKADFRTFYRDAHAVTCLTEREKMLMGLAVAMMRLCDP
jgi:hypothetical protein